MDTRYTDADYTLITAVGGSLFNARQQRSVAASDILPNIELALDMYSQTHTFTPFGAAFGPGKAYSLGLYLPRLTPKDDAMATTDTPHICTNGDYHEGFDEGWKAAKREPKMAPLTDTHGEPYALDGEGEPIKEPLPASIVLDAILEDLCHTIAHLAKNATENPEASYWPERQDALYDAMREIRHIYGDTAD